MKRILAMGMVLLMLLTAAGCSAKKEKSSAKAATVVHAEEAPAPSAEVKEEEKKPEASKQKESAKKEQKKPETQQTVKEVEEQVSDLLDQLVPSVQTPQETPVEQPQEQPVSPLLQRNTEMEQKLVGSWYETVDMSDVMGTLLELQIEPGQYTVSLSYTYQDGMMSIAFDTEQMRTVLKALVLEACTRVSAEQGMTLEQAGITEEAIDQTVDAYMIMMTQMMQPMEYTVYDGNVLWHGGIREGEILEITDTRVVVQHDDGRQTIMTR